MFQGHKYRGPGSIRQGDLEVEVECEYEVNRADGTVEWHGHFRAVDPASEPEPGEARLLAGGKTADIVVVGVSAGTGSGRFEGSGPPPT